ncbi:hypothetical protein [Gilvimarinus sp. 1_MG-2023]|uniref:hypothetical protein n=1 Tax=Gilvimarinus sp. 1_MG-2023 TaxID=3062638 RepID=UPI0026E38922|nr:hypothetical protein [Gilvimarinus sp. 1_MG-2023]MDO6748138.1 hypothetical protein [Gilvimarinus sp. 1_MG-2023]
MRSRHVRFLTLWVLLAPVLSACDKDTTLYTSGDKPELVMIAINNSGEVFTSIHKESLSIEALSTEIARLLNNDTDYRFVIQSDIGGSAYKDSVIQSLTNSGVKIDYIAAP